MTPAEIRARLSQSGMTISERELRAWCWILLKLLEEK
jgi:hypothetical protein